MVAADGRMNPLTSQAREQREKGLELQFLLVTHPSDPDFGLDPALPIALPWGLS